MTFRTFAGRTLAARSLAAGAAMTLLAGPAWAACEDDIQALDEQVVAEETGAAPAGGGLPATQHQQQVLSGDNDDALETGAGGSGDVEATSPHQRQAVRELDDDTKTQASEMLDEARQMAQAGDEAGCQAKVTETEALLGVR